MRKYQESVTGSCGRAAHTAYAVMVLFIFIFECGTITAHFVSRRGLPSFAVEPLRNVQNGFTTSLWYCKYACSFNSELGRSPDGIQLEIFNEGMKIYRTDFDILGVDGNFRFWVLKSLLYSVIFSFFGSFLSLLVAKKRKKWTYKIKRIIIHTF